MSDGNSRDERVEQAAMTGLLADLLRRVGELEERVAALERTPQAVAAAREADALADRHDRRDD